MDLREKILGSGSLPSLPTAAVKLLELSKSPDAGIQDLCDVIKSDPAITVRVIRAANASYFGLRNEVTSIEKAAMMLGPGMLTTVTLTFYLAEQSVADGQLARHFSGLWLQAVTQAAASETILKVTEQKGASTAFLAGLLCDVGQLAMLRVLGDQYVDVKQSAISENCRLVDVERSQLGFDHVDLGLELGKKWGLPNTVIESIEHHHYSAEELSAESALEDPISVKATVVGASVAEYLCVYNAAHAWHRLRENCRQLFDLDGDELIDFLAVVHERLQNASSLFDIDTRQLPEIMTIMAEATELLAQNAMQIQAVTHQAMADRQELEQAKQQLEREKSEMHDRMIRDTLTGVFSRSYFEEQLSIEIKKCNRSGAPLGVLFCDIDHFKSLNDTYGHQFGDQVLRTVAQSIQGAVRQSDIVARYGGEEFVVITHTNDEEGAAIVGEKIRAAVADLQFTSDQGTVEVTISVGVCYAPSIRNELNEISESLVRQADISMYTAKKSGRNRVVTVSLGGEKGDEKPAGHRSVSPPMGLSL